MLASTARIASPTASASLASTPCTHAPYTKRGEPRASARGDFGAVPPNASALLCWELMSVDDETGDLDGEAEVVGDDDVQDAGGGMTMQLDAVVDSMEDVAVAPDVGPVMSRPPPLPPPKISKGMWIVGVLIVLAMAGLGIGAGAYMLGSGGDTPTATAPSTPATPGPTAGTPSEGTPGEGTPSEGTPSEGEPSGVVQLDEIVFDDSAEETPPPPSE